MIEPGIKRVIITASHKLDKASNFDATSFREFVYLVTENSKSE